MSITVTGGDEPFETFDSADEAANRYPAGTLFQDLDGDPCLLASDGGRGRIFVLFSGMDFPVVADGCVAFPVRVSAKSVLIQNT